MIKILHILSDTNIGGAGRLLYNLFMTVDKEKYEFVFVFPKDSALCELFRSKNAKIYEIECGRDVSFDIRASISVCRLIKKINPDIVHTHSSFYGRIGAKFASIDTKNIVYTKHCVFDTPKYMDNKISKFIYGKLDDILSGRIVAVAESAKDELVKYGVNPSKIDVIINGTPPLTETTEDEKRELKKQLNIGEGLFIAGISARLEEYKGHKTIIEAAVKLKKDGIDDILFIILGSGSYEKFLKEYVEKMNVEDRVLFLGFKDEVYPYVNIFDVNLNSSVGTETSSLAISEGLSIGKVIIASDFGGNPNMVINGKTGYLFKKSDASELAERIKKLKQNPALLKQMSENAKEDYRLRFSAHIMAEQYEKFYKEIKTNQSVR